MGIRILLSNGLSEDSPGIQCEVEPGEKVSGIIETAVGYWGLDKDVIYGVKCGAIILPPEKVITDEVIKEGEKLVVVDSKQWQVNLEKVKNWIVDNLDASSKELVMLRSNEKGSNLTEYILKNTKKAGRYYVVTFSNGEVGSYRPL